MRRKLSLEQAEQLLPDGDWIHVFVSEGHKEGEMWSRGRVIERMRDLGVELGGPDAVRHQHGLVSKGNDTVYIQMRMAKPARESGGSDE